MATSNFYNDNASKIFASQIIEEWDYNDLIQNVEHSLQHLDEYYHSGRESSSRYNLENGRYLESALSKTKYYADNTNIEVVIHGIVRSGYYEGVNLDWSFDYYIDGVEVFGESCISDYLIDYEDVSEKKALLLGQSRFKQLEKIKEKLANKIESVFEDYTTPLVVAAKFSNGETIYEKA